MKRLRNIVLPICAVLLLSSCAEEVNKKGNNTPPPVISEGLSNVAILHDSPKIGTVTFKAAEHIQGSSYVWSIEGVNLSNNQDRQITADFTTAGSYLVSLNVDGIEYKGNIIIPNNEPSYEIDMGKSHTIISDKTQKRLFVYGDNSKGQLCIEKSITSLKEPRILKSYTSEITSVASGNNHTLFTDNTYIYGCGDNSFGQLGLGSTDVVDNAVTISSIPQISNIRRIFVSSGGDMSVAGIEFLEAAAPKISIYHWGYDDTKENKIQSSAKELATSSSRDDVLFATGGNFSILRATSSYNVFSFGINDKWQLGRIQGAGTGYPSKGEEEKNSPDNNPTLNKTDMASGFVFTPYGEENNYVNYYQNNYFGKIATGDDFVVSIKKETKEDSSYTQIPKNSLYVWGNNEYGQLGFTSSNISVGRATPLFDALQGEPMTTDPNKVKPIQKEMVEVAAGRATGYAISSDGILYGWGDESKSQLTNNKQANQTNNMVYEIANPKGVTQGYKKVWAGGDRVIALAGDNNLYTWGDNKNGILGTNNSADTVDIPEKLFFSLAPVE